MVKDAFTALKNSDIMLISKEIKMFIRISNIKLPFDSDNDALFRACAERLKIKQRDIKEILLHKKSLDARRAGNISYIYTADVFLKDNTKYTLSENAERIENEEKYEIPCLSLGKRPRPVIVGFGPCGIFCALVLARAGLKPIILERGKPVADRVNDVESFFRTGKLNTSSNIQFGEGGAGTFSDGKLNTLVKDREHRGRFVLTELVKAGAPEEILYINKPHVGTDKLRASIQNIRKEIEALGGEVLFEHKLTGLIISDNKLCGVLAVSNGEEIKLDTDTLFLAIGHSARDTFQMLKELGMNLERKPFAVGVRIEHLQEMINDIQYKGAKSEKLPAADYKLVCHTSSGRSVYTFCMCPGGEVVAAASEENMVVTNGMSNFSRDGKNANAALLVEVRPDDFPGDDPLSGMYFQRELEKSAYIAGGGEYKAPAQLVGDFLKGKSTSKAGAVKPTYSRGVKYVDLHEVLPEYITKALSEGLVHFDSIMHGFACDDAVMTAVESRSSSPVRILRNSETMQSATLGIYPMGEGAGYAGGIMSAAMDGMKAAEKYINSIMNADL